MRLPRRALTAVACLALAAGLRAAEPTPDPFRLVPKQADEFVCSSCFLVHHHNQLALRKDGQQFCTDCV